LGTTILKNSEDAANLITKAAGALKATSAGDVKVDLSKLGADFKFGADSMNKGVESGIDAVADSQIKMLDSLI